MPSGSCYYGFDLRRIRSGALGASAVDNSIVDFTTFQSFYALNILIPSGGTTTSQIIEGICTTKNVCDVSWQNFMKCLVIDKLAKKADGSSYWNVSDCIRPDTECTRQANLNKRC